MTSPYQYVSPINLPEEVGFDTHANFCGCKICGAIYQSDLDRKERLGTATPQERIQATVQRKNWTIYHAKTHSHREHNALAVSGRFCTPEAAYKLASYGVISIPLTGELETSVDDETRHAQAEAKRLATDSPSGEPKGSSTIYVSKKE